MGSIYLRWHDKVCFNFMIRQVRLPASTSTRFHLEPIAQIIQRGFRDVNTSLLEDEKRKQK